MNWICVLIRDAKRFLLPFTPREDTDYAVCEVKKVFLRAQRPETLTLNCLSSLWKNYEQQIHGVYKLLNVM